jgi:hypothetical protein
MSETWADEAGARDFVKELKRQRQGEVEMLVGAARNSSDPAIVRSWAAIAQLDKVIAMMEEERGKPD